MGRSVPEVDNFRALPTPSGAIWPQMLLDISYRGARRNVLPDLHPVAFWCSLRPVAPWMSICLPYGLLRLCCGT